MWHLMQGARELQRLMQSTWVRPAHFSRNCPPRPSGPSKTTGSPAWNRGRGFRALAWTASSWTHAAQRKGQSQIPTCSSSPGGGPPHTTAQTQCAFICAARGSSANAGPVSQVFEGGVQARGGPLQVRAHSSPRHRSLGVVGGRQQRSSHTLSPQHGCYVPFGPKFVCGGRTPCFGGKETSPKQGSSLSSKS